MKNIRQMKKKIYLHSQNLTNSKKYFKNIKYYRNYSKFNKNKLSKTLKKS